MKIGVLIDRLNVGGVEKVAIEQVRALRELGADARLLVLRRESFVEQVLDRLGTVPVEYLDDRMPSLLKFSFRIPPFYFFSIFHLTYPRLLLPWIKPKEWDYIVSHNSYTSITARRLAKSRDIPYALYVHDPVAYILDRVYLKGLLRKLPVFGLGRAVDTLLINAASAIFVAGSPHQEYLQQISKRLKVYVVPPGGRLRDNLPAARGEHFLTATAWKEGKQLEDLLQVLAKVGAARLKVAGTWVHNAYRTRIEHLIMELGLQNRVQIVGEVNDQQLADLFAESRASITVNEERGFGLAALDAASNGCTFVIPSTSGAARFFEKDVDGLYFEHGDILGLQHHVTRLLEDERLAYAMGMHAWETVRTKYTWKRQAEFVLNIISAKVP